MKHLAIAAAALLALAGPASAQIYAGLRTLSVSAAAMSGPVTPWMQDDGSSSDHPTHSRSDFQADGLNWQYRNGLTAPMNGAGEP